MSTFAPKRSIEFKIQNPGCEEPFFDHELYCVKWVTQENRFSDKNRALVLSEQNSEKSRDFFKRIYDLDTSVDFIDRVSFYSIISNFNEIKKAVKENGDNFVGEFQDAFDSMAMDVEALTKVCEKVAHKQLEEGIISFHLVPFLYKAHDKIEVNSLVPHAGIVTKMPDIINSSSGLYVHIIYNVIEVIEKPKLAQREEYIPYYYDVKPVSELKIKPLSEEKKKDFGALGKKTLQCAIAPCYKYISRYKIIKVESNFFSVSYKAIEISREHRAIIDSKNVSKLNKTAYDNYKGFFGFVSYVDIAKDLNEEDHPFILPTLVGYIPQQKLWAVIDMTNVSEIKFSEKALVDLVLPAESKSILRSLVKNSVDGFSDIIQGKSGGTVLCLEGCPGVGKTLTAEAIAEHLHKPLIVISSGSLGSTAKEIEENLKKELSITEEWNAVALIDEADVFMSKRQSNDIEHNAVVSVFLRCLEYYRGVMFVTTNRKGEIDEAFKSRILLTLRYNSLKYSDRIMVWSNLLRNANITANAKELAIFPINGRQIKNAIRISENIDSEVFDAKEKNPTKRIKKVLKYTYANEFSVWQKIGMIFRNIIR